MYIMLRELREGDVFTIHISTGVYRKVGDADGMATASELVDGEERGCTAFDPRTMVFASASEQLGFRDAMEEWADAKGEW